MFELIMWTTTSLWQMTADVSTQFFSLSLNLHSVSLMCSSRLSQRFGHRLGIVFSYLPPWLSSFFPFFPLPFSGCDCPELSPLVLQTSQTTDFLSEYYPQSVGPALQLKAIMESHQYFHFLPVVISTPTAARVCHNPMP